jgi:hypothetical protein
MGRFDRERALDLSIRQYMQRFLKITASVLAAVCVLFLLYCLFAILVWRNVGTGTDLRATSAIRAEFTSAIGTNFSRQIDFATSFSRDKSVIYIKSDVSGEERNKLNMIVKAINLSYSNRVISIKYESAAN